MKDAHGNRLADGEVFAMKKPLPIPLEMGKQRLKNLQIRKEFPKLAEKGVEVALAIP